MSHSVNPGRPLPTASSWGEAAVVTVMVPGFADDERCLTALQAALAQAGLPAVAISPQPSTGEVALEQLAGQLAEAIVARFGESRPLNLFGFSMGGLIVRYYLQILGGVERVQRLVTLATPHRGTWLGWLFRREASRQMRPGSAFLQELNRDLSPLERVQFTSIWTPLDLTIVPAWSSRLPVGRSQIVWAPFHGTLLQNPRVHRAVVQALGGRG
ncbi:alpha/beta fold hydrolase [Litorilinea aerophila]|uniref:Alpha/beta fold hydrolase n=1 Tax=Litorilinea aerophila TaxID=1204385 RepID=A0A540VMD5_9CHLR|nr:alpha/beta fold hydrolase [Litorilinea aerophila]MCC9074553.1 alpha/beta fold hydrolase [Litorilinea aerophila]